MKSNYYFHVDDFGRSINISKSILESITKGNLNSVSILVNFIDDKFHFKLKKIKNLNKRLHINLTEIPKDRVKKNYFLSNLSFIKLIFLNKHQKKIIYKEIDNQINEYKRIYKTKRINIDGHQHVHMIPWILSYLLKLKKKHSIDEIRNSNECLIPPKLNDLIKLRYYRNLDACIVVKFFYFFSGSPKLSSYNFFGIVYSDMQSEKHIIRYLDLIKKIKIKKFEILIHSGFTNYREKILSTNNNLKFYTSKNRKKEYKLTFSNKIKKKLAKFNNEN